MGEKLRAVGPSSVTPIDVLPTPIKKVREAAKARFASMLNNMFDSTDDVLFEMADRSGSDAGQPMFFSSMRELRMKRKEIEKSFVESIYSAFQKLLRLPKLGETARDAAANPETGSLSLVNDADLEENVAISGMVAKIVNQNGLLLTQISQRMDSLVPHMEVTNANNPVGAEVICEAFKASCGPLKLDIRAKLVVHKIFDRTVVCELEALYADLNQMLFNLGVMPGLKAVKIKKSPNSGSDEPQRKVNATLSETDRNLLSKAQQAFSALQSLISESKLKRSSTADLIPVVDEGDEPVLTGGDLVELFSSIQDQSVDRTNLVEMQPGRLDVYTALHNALQSSANVHPKALRQAEDDTINLISMLFEFILDDHHLSNPMKALLARMQIPLLKVAILDKGFFTRGGHPARKLLNGLATAALGWSESKEVDSDPLYKEIRNIVEIVLNEFVDDLTLFDQLLTRFTEFVSKEQRRAELIERRTRDAEEGLAVSKRARSIVGFTLNELAVGKKLPHVVIDLLGNGWDKYMFLLHVREGVDRKQWKAAIQTAADLVWSVEEKPDRESRNELLKLIPSLLKRMRKGLETISYEKRKMREKFRSLENIHLRCLKGDSLDADYESTANGRIVAPTAGGPSEGDVFSNHPDDESLISDIEDITDEQIIQSPIIFKDSVDKIEESQPEAQENDPTMKVINSMSAGTWVEFTREGEPRMRAKVAAILKASGKFIFVNRLGIKIAEEDPRSMADLIKNDTVAILDNSLVFDRALESVIGHLRQMKN